jgi:transcriptional regulator GlxA family with amidase domain
MPNQQARGSSFGFLLLPCFSMMSLSALLEPLRMANKVLGLDYYDWHIFTWDDEPVKANNNLLFSPEYSSKLLLTGELKPDYLILIAGDNVHRYYQESLRNLLRSCYRQGVRIGATSTASFLLGYAQLLGASRCTVHWEYLTAFREEFADVNLTQSLFEIEDRILTCSGGLAGLDMLLQLIALEHGKSLSDKIADQYLLSNIRDTDSEQRNSLVKRYQVHNRALLRVLALMEQNIETPLTLSQLAQGAHLSGRQLQRLFTKHLNLSVQQFYRRLRIDKASNLLRETDLSNVSIALICGFGSSSYFSKCFRQYKGVSPRDLRASNNKYS